MLVIESRCALVCFIRRDVQYKHYMLASYS